MAVEAAIVTEHFSQFGTGFDTRLLLESNPVEKK